MDLDWGGVGNGEEDLLMRRQSCNRFGHIAKNCPGVGNNGGGSLASRISGPAGNGRSAVPLVKCFKCGGPNHLAKCVSSLRTFVFSVLTSE